MRFLSVLILFGLQSQPSPRVGGIDARLDRTVQNYKVEESSLPRALIAVASHFEIPMGIEWIEPATPRPIKLSWKQTTVRQVIRSIASAQGDYEVERGTVVHVFYRGAKSDKSNFLNIRLAQFEVKNQYIALALRDLHREVNSRMRGISPNQDWVGHWMLEPNDHRLTVDFRQVTVRNILDRLVPLSGRPIWSVAFQPQAGLTPGGFRRTHTLWNNSRTSDGYEPILDRFAWGKELPPEIASK